MYDFSTRTDLLSSRGEIEEAVRFNFRKFRGGTFLYSKDTNANPASEFDSSSMKVLVLFLSSGKMRFASSTFMALEGMIKKEFGEKVFVDFSYVPPPGDFELYKELRLPHFFGAISKAPTKDFDLVLVSQAILPEVLNVPSAFYNSGIPLSHSERMEDDDFPLLMFGGASATNSHILHGEFEISPGKTGAQLVDLCVFGYAEGVLPNILREFYNLHIQEFRKTGILHQLLCASREKDYIFYPANFKYTFGKDGFSTTSIEKVVESLGPDRAKYSSKYLRSDEYMNFEKKIFNTNGDYSDSVSSMISMACSSHLCTFCLSGDTIVETNLGKFTLRSLNSSPEGHTHILSAEGVMRPFERVDSMGERPLFKVDTLGGKRVFVTPDHRLIGPRGGNIYYQIKADKLSGGDLLWVWDNGRMVEDIVTQVMPAGAEETFDVINSGDSMFFANGILSHNCNEGILGGGWRQRTLSALEKDFRTQQKFAAANAQTFYSYNLNFYSPFLDLLSLSSRFFSRLSLVNMRADVIAADPTYLDLSKAMGLMRVSMAIEGMGGRIRDKILNKNLSRETFLRAIDHCTRHNFVLIKLGVISTGWETEEDVADFISELEECIAVRDRNGSKCRFQLSITPLVIYDTVPLRWMERSAARISLSGEKNMRVLTDWCKEHGIRSKINGRGPGTYLEQLFLDLGRAGTSALVKTSIADEQLYDRHLDPSHLDSFTSHVKESGIDPEGIFFERPADYIFPSDVLEFVPSKKVKLWREQHEKADFYIKHCLSTVAAPKTRCYSCKSCETTEDIMSIVKRGLAAKSTVPDIQVGISDFRHVSSTRFLVKIKPESFFQSKAQLSHFLTSQLLRRDDRLLDSFHSVGKSTIFWSASNDLDDYFGGRFVFDVRWKNPVDIPFIKNLFPDVNAALETSELLDVSSIEKKEEIIEKGNIVYRGTVRGFSFQSLKDALAKFDERVPFAQKTPDLKLVLEKSLVPGVKNLISWNFSNGLIHYFAVLPLGLNPYLLLSAIFKVSYRNSLIMSTADIVDHVVDAPATCDCGNPLTYSLMDRAVHRKCPLCLGKLYLSRLK